MLIGEFDSFKVLNDSISGHKPIDEDSCSSVSILTERLERLKRSNNLFADVSFSPYVEELASADVVMMLS